MKRIVLLLLVLMVTIYGWSQGCVAIRNVAGVSPDLLFKNIQPRDKLILNIANRYFNASSTFVGDEFVTDSIVTNRIYTLNISALMLINKGWSLAFSIPVSANSRNNNRDHGGQGTARYTTRSFGLGDMRLVAYKWLIDPTADRKWNIQPGLGIKFPTGDYKYQDYFIRKDSGILAPVDQAIQLGDGGTGIITELSAFYSISRPVNIFFQGHYLINPREQNGVSNLKGKNPTQTEINNHTTVMSVPDQYSLRGGINFQYQKLVLTTALRYENVPTNDLIGGNKGFRRAASISSIEPGASYLMKNVLAFIYVGIPFKRNIIQNFQNNKTPAGFADYVFTFGIQVNP